ncbi:MAG: hypothetical protein AVDCRST_MAG11-1374 [uncultured Gemmatimonadaceae bacterium]|uniref:Uncharacterized protein n=1 Tax=uncultured Gemmatimonadaceae bacterium TaxID=246130 RepID=A0A6J4KLM3_9BACT|nr:MAG: hypothetical protein AVDCRST_MAG11-1374 [uncultured Gemmatimonadaceae bacterium]
MHTASRPKERVCRSGPMRSRTGVGSDRPRDARHSARQYI